ncbi:Hydantoin racemase [Mycolicibacterium vanbaalenii]|uniref:Hydantoin racemase n=1 Tax=Mycolicibacterium vanbaalenii TaxID=110539 RepID=A0A5S9R8Z9_MYCVN|nr:aspartate/glutamate racemase family protein [Mycolicibacterium vanbaalenii]CAA0131887.1 Hydantoin racemase [Mycolicibacterium vanbaalenii]
MKIKVINPNTTASMTAMIAASARASVAPGTHVDAVNPTSGPESIESHYDEALAAIGVLREIEAGEVEGYDGYVIACFGDPGLLAAREVARGPVVGIAEASMRTAGYLGRKFTVVTTLARTVGRTWDIAVQYGVAEACSGIRACEIPVVELERDPTAYASIRDVAQTALVSDGADVIVLGCAGMSDLCTRLQTELQVPVIDGVAAATTQVEALVRMGLRTATRGEFAAPPAKLRS